MAKKKMEQRQSETRIIFLSGFLLFFTFIQQRNDIAQILLAYLIVALVVFLWIKIQPEKIAIRRILTMTGDIFSISACLYLLPDQTASIAMSMYLWIIVGYSFRYGKTYGCISTGLSFIGLIIATLMNNLWNSYPYLIIGHVFLITVIPIFTIKMLGEIKKAKANAEKANAFKSEFITNVSHELRTPLNGIMGANELLSLLYSDKQHNELTAIIDQSANHLLDVIEDILNMSKIEAGKMKLMNEPFDIKSTINSVVSMFKIQSEKKDIELVLELSGNIPQFVIGDSKFLRQIMINTIGNAIKFTDKGQVAISAKIKEKNNSLIHIEFQIKDTGIGMTESEIKNIFEQFTQANNKISKKYGGTGLGMTITRELINMMNGDIQVKSTKGKGTCFTICIPFNKTAFEYNEKPAKQEEKIHHILQALVVEDNDINQTIIEKMLKEIGYQTVIANDGEEALDIFSIKKFDLILLDINLPGINGIETMKAMKFMDTKNNAPVIMFSADASEKIIKECMDAGADGYLKKPVTIQKLKNKIASLKVNSTHKVKSKNIQKIDTEIITDLIKTIGSKKTIFGFIDKFKAGTSKKIMYMKTCAYKNNHDEFLKVLHSIKGSAAMLGMISLAGICENIAKNNLDKENMLSQLKLLEMSCEEETNILIEHIQNLRETD